jgi:VWFA-related protein
VAGWAVRWAAVVLTLGLLWPAAAVFGQPAPLAVALQRVDDQQFPSVVAYASVADERGLPIAGLDRAAFEVAEDGRPVADVQVEAMPDSQEPVAVALVVDVSGSMGDAGKLDGARTAARALIDGLGPRDSAAVLAFADTVRVVQGFTADRSALRDALGTLSAKGDTALYDAVAQGALLTKALPETRKILVLLTDGENTRSARTRADAIRAAQDTTGVVFAVGVGPDVQRGFLDDLARATAGQALYVNGADGLPSAFRAIADQLRLQYVLRYRSTLAADGRAHQLTVRATQAGRTAEATRSYNAVAPPLAFDLDGIADGPIPPGRRRIEAQVRSGALARLELLVDDQPRAAATAPPFVLAWDAEAEAPGRHRVVVRATDAAGRTRDQAFTVETAGPPPTTVPTAAAPTPSVATPTVGTVATPAEPARADQAADWRPLAAAFALIALVLVIAVLLLRREPPPRPVEVSEPTENADKTLDMRPDDVVAVARRSSPRARLRLLIDGVEHDLALADGTRTIGRGPGNDLALPDALVSRHHASVVFEDGAYWIEDRASRNGTWVNDQEVEGRRSLAPGDAIRVGRTSVLFLLDAPVAPVPPSRAAVMVGNGQPVG